MSSLENMFIADGYISLLHADSHALTTAKTVMYDGAGNASAIALGTAGNGASITGTFVADGVTYPASSEGSTGNFLQLDSNKKLNFISTINSSYLTDLSPSPANTYDGVITGMVVNSKGLVTSVTTADLDTLTVTRTTYRTNASNDFSSFKFTNSNWKKITLPSAVPSDALAAILFIRPNDLMKTKNGYSLIESSPDNGDSVYPVVYSAGGEDGSGGDDFHGSGCQFISRISRVGGDMVFYLRQTGDQPTGDGWNVQWGIHLIGYQQ